MMSRQPSARNIFFLLLMPRSLLIFGNFLLIALAVMLGVVREHGSLSSLARWWAAPTVSAADQSPPPSTHKVFSKLLQSVGVDDPQGEITIDSLFRTDNKNLYLYVYQQIFGRPEKDALLELSTAYGLSPLEAQSVINGVISPLLRRQTAAYTQDRAIADMQKIRRSYERILKQQQLAYETGAIVAATEIFANGSLDDSSFDLIHDLDIIEQILFVDRAKVIMNSKSFKNPLEKKSPFGTSSAGLSGTGGNSTASSGGGTSGATPPAKSSGNDGGNVGDNVGDNVGGKVTPPNSPTTIEDVIAGKKPGEVPVDICLKDSPINKALADNKAKTSEGGKTGGGTSGATPSSGEQKAGTGASSGAPPPATSSPTTPVNIATVTPPEYRRIATTPATPVTLPKSDLCSNMKGTPEYQYPEKSSDKSGGINMEILFCVTLDTTKRTYTSFYPGQSCIQCTIAAMNESMKVLLGKSLAPNKLTGNVYESTKCKSTLNVSDQLSMNIFLIPTPIITPQKLGPLVGHDIAKEWERYTKNALPFKKTPGASSERVTQESIQNLPKDVSQSQLITEISGVVAGEVSAARQRVAQHPSSVQTDSKSEGYQQVIKEMRIMTSFFASFQETFRRFNEVTCKKFDEEENIP